MSRYSVISIAIISTSEVLGAEGPLARKPISGKLGNVGNGTEGNRTGGIGTRDKRTGGIRTRDIRTGGIRTRDVRTGGIRTGGIRTEGIRTEGTRKLNRRFLVRLSKNTTLFIQFTFTF